VHTQSVVDYLAAVSPSANGFTQSQAQQEHTAVAGRVAIHALTLAPIDWLHESEVPDPKLHASPGIGHELAAAACAALVARLQPTGHITTLSAAQAAAEHGPQPGPDGPVVPRGAVAYAVAHAVAHCVLAPQLGAANAAGARLEALALSPALWEWAYATGLLV
jgi:hypothetical protein